MKLVLLYIISGLFFLCLLIPAIWLQITDRKETEEEKEDFRSRVHARKEEKMRNIIEDLLKQTQDDTEIIKYIQEKKLEDIFTTDEIQKLIIEIKKEYQLIPIDIEPTSAEASH